jgi:hypothetical protein
MSGLMYFNGCHTTMKEALVPNGTEPPHDYPNIPTHYASVWVEADDLDHYHWWPDPELHQKRQLVFKNKDSDEETAYVHEFRIPEPAIVTFPDELDAPAHFHRFEYALPRLQRPDNYFEVDLDNPNVIARVSIRGGELHVYVFKKVASVKWTIKHPADPMKIRANQYSITLTPQANEIVFSNNSDLLEGDYQGHDCDVADPDNHFYLYSQIEKRRNGSGLVIPCYPKNLQPLWYQHAYLKKLNDIRRLNDSGCTGSCC